MAGDWVELSLHDAGVELLDCVHSTPSAIEDGYPYIAIPQIKNGRIDPTDARRISHDDYLTWTRKTKPQPSDVILSRRCNPGETAVVPPDLDFALGQNLVILRSTGDTVFPPFLRWLLRSPAWWEQVRKFINVGAVFESLKCADVPNFLLPFPPLKEQRVIACILGALDDKIELNRRMNRTLEATARAIFESWFVEFDPVRAKAAGQQPPGLKPDLAALFPDSFEDSEIGEIPDGWTLCTVNDLADVNARTLGQDDALDVIDYVEISKVMRGEVSEVTRYQRGTEPSRARRRLTHGDTVVSTVRPDRGAYFICLHPPETLIASTGFAVATPKKSLWAFLYAALTRPEIGEELGRLADGGAYPAVRPGVIGGLPLVAPRDRRIVDVFERIAQPLLEKAEANRIESRTLATIRDALLPKLLSGETRVPDAECFVEHAE